MTELEKVIEGLTQVILHLDVMRQISSGKDELRYRELRDYAEDALELLKERQWVSVKDRLPEKGQNVIAFLHDDSYEILTFVIDSNVGKCWESTLCYFIEFWKVTHWMPLPEPPEEEEG